MNSEEIKFTSEHLKTVANKAASEAVERTIQARSASDSDLMREIGSLRKEVAEVKETLEGWRSGTKLAFWIFVGLGGLITWVLNSFGIHFGIK